MAIKEIALSPLWIQSVEKEKRVGHTSRLVRDSSAPTDPALPCSRRLSACRRVQNADSLFGLGYKRTTPLLFLKSILQSLFFSFSLLPFLAHMWPPSGNDTRWNATTAESLRRSHTNVHSTPRTHRDGKYEEHDGERREAPTARQTAPDEKFTPATSL